MFTAQTHPRWALRRLLALLFLTCLALFVTSVAAAAAHPPKRPTASVASATSRALDAAALATTQADRRLVARARAQRACQIQHRKHCKASQLALQRAGRHLTSSESHLSRLARGNGHSSRAAGAKQAPLLSISGLVLSWTRPGGVNTFVFVRKVPGQPDQYSVINGASTTPPPVPGYSVRYSVRTNVNGSAWAPEQSIAYPALTPPVQAPSTLPTTPPTDPAPPTTPTAPTPPTDPTPPTTPPTTPPINLQTAPIITVSGQTLNWVQIGNVSAYVFVIKVPGRPDQYSEISGTSITPPAVPGATVRYSVRTAVEGSAWAPEVSIAYPPASTPPSEPPAPEPPAAPEPPTTLEPPTTPEPPAAPAEPESPAPLSGFQPGLNSGTDLTNDVPGATLLGAKVVRVEFSIGTSPAQMQNTIVGYAAKGIRVAPLAGFYATMPSSAEAQNLANWARTYGPGGSFWANRSDGRLAIQTIEFGNETSYGYQYGDGSSSASYATRAQNYALRLKAAAEAISSTGIKVGLLAQDDNWTGDWMNGMYAAVPNLSSYVAGWVIHPYGIGWQGRLQDLINQAAAHGAPSTIPIDITEWGIATDNGRCLSDNYGMNKCMSYTEAANTMSSNVAAIRQMLGSRLNLFMLYQVRDQAKTGTSTNREAYFGALQHELQPKGAFTEQVKTLMASS